MYDAVSSELSEVNSILGEINSLMNINSYGSAVSTEKWEHVVLSNVEWLQIQRSSL